MKWGKLGIIERPLGTEESVSHCYIPTPIVLKNIGVVRVYYASWDVNNRGRIFYTDFEMNDLMRVRKRSKTPVLGVGEPGTFDSDGVSPQFAYLEANKIYLLYQGFQRTVYPKINMMLTGIAYGEPNSKLIRWSQTPFLERTPLEPFIRSAPCIIVEGKYARLWYTSGLTGWEPCKDNSHWDSYPQYDIAYTQSTKMDGLRSSSRILCNIKRPDELGVSRPWVIKDGSSYKMWFSYRKENMLYRIGYAESIDGIYWVRLDDQVGIHSDKLYDSEMICFGAVVDVGNERYMFYNGNDHGREGIALAILEQD